MLDLAGGQIANLDAVLPCVAQRDQALVRFYKLLVAFNHLTLVVRAYALTDLNLAVGPNVLSVNF